MRLPCESWNDVGWKNMTKRRRRIKRDGEWGIHHSEVCYLHGKVEWPNTLQLLQWSLRSFCPESIVRIPGLGQSSRPLAPKVQTKTMSCCCAKRKRVRRSFPSA